MISPNKTYTGRFPYQSYHSTSLLQTAILDQPRGDLIINNAVTSTPQVLETITGYAVALHPSSETPIAIEFYKDTNKTTNPQILKPGQFLRAPHNEAFTQIRFGVPFGWLGGGVYHLIVYTAPTVHIDWSEQTELIFHRVTMQVKAPAAITNAPLNWPLRFPWTQAFANTANQNSKPQLYVTPTKVAASLRLTSLGAPATLSFLFQKTYDFSLDANNVGTATDVRRYDYTVPSYAAIVGLGGNLANPWPVFFLPDEVVRLSADDGGLALVSSDASLQGAYVDFVRYGRL